MNYEFTIERISQHMIRYGLDLRPILSLKQRRSELQDYCNWLIERFGGLYETLLSGPNQLNIQKNFILPNGKKMQFPTFVLNPRGPIFAFPQRVFVDQVHNLDIGDYQAVFEEALAELKSRFLEQKLTRLGIVHELVFDTGSINSIELVASNLKNDIWRQRIKNLNMQFEMPTEDKNVIMQIKPTFVQKSGAAPVPGNAPYGVIVIVDINNRQLSSDLSTEQIEDIVTFSSEYVPKELVRFLNNEY